MGGSVLVDSVFGEGTEFTINLSTKVSHLSEPLVPSFEMESFIEKSLLCANSKNTVMEKINNKQICSSSKKLNCLVANDDNF